jgi:hypothetical protein
MKARVGERMHVKNVRKSKEQTANAAGEDTRKSDFEMKCVCRCSHTQCRGVRVRWLSKRGGSTKPPRSVVFRVSHKRTRDTVLSAVMHLGCVVA